MRALVLYTASVQDEIAAGRGGRRRGRARPRRRGSTTCCCRSSRATARRSPTSCSAAVAADLRRLRLPAGLPDRAVHPRRQDRHPLRGHHGDPGPGLLLPQDRAGPGPGADQADDRRSRSSPRATRATARCAAERDLLAKALEDVQGIVGTMVGSLTAVRRGRHQHLQGRPEHHPPAAGLGDLVVGWLLLRQAAVALGGARGRRHRRGTRRSTGQGRGGEVLRRARCCRCSPPSARSPRASTTP